MNKDYDFCGWATKNDLLCSDGRTIKHGAFSHQDGVKVPLMWNHMHSAASNILGHAILKEEDEGMRAYGYFNDTQQGRDGKAILQHGDIEALSICATKLKQDGRRNVLHGDIKEVSLVISPANPGAWIDTVISHSDDYDEEIILYTGEPLDFMHAEKVKGEDPEEEDKSTKEDSNTVGDVLKSFSEKEEKAAREVIKSALTGDKNVSKESLDIIDSLDEKKKTAVYAIIGGLLENKKKEKEPETNEEDNKEMKHNVFEGSVNENPNVLTHSDEMEIVEIAKKTGSFQDALVYFMENNEMEINHADDIAAAGGFVQPPTEGNVTLLFPEYKDIRPGAPELITNDQTWVSKVMNKVHKSPISRIRTGQVDIRNIDALRAKGYKKGTKKALTGNFKLVRRTTDPQTVYVKNALHRDDIVDITDFDYVNYLYKIDRMMLDEELATAIMIGDGRDDLDADKISEDHIRSIWHDDDLYTIHRTIDLDATAAELQGTDTATYFGENFIFAEAMVNACLYARETYKGSGTPDMYIAPHDLNVMLLARDRNGHRLYNGVNELATALNVANIITVEQFAGKTREVEDPEGGESTTNELICIICNLSDYHLGATKGGQVSHFTQFDIDFNQEKSLIETRVSGALTRVYSAIAIEKPQASF